MPTVPRYDSPTVAPQGVPVPQAQGTSAASFGAELGQGVQQAAAGLDQMARQQQDEMDAARITAVIPMLDDAEHQVVTAARSKQGWDALPVHDQAVGAFDKTTGEIVNGLANDRQKTIVRRMAAQQRGSISTQLDNYTNSEVRKAQGVDAQVAADSTANLAVSHYQDSQRLAQDFNKGEALIRSYGQRAGLAPETVQAQVDQWKSGVHVGVVERALQDQQVDLARTYLEANKGAIEGGQLGRLEKAVADSGTLADAFAATDRIMAATSDLGTAQKMVREIKDPEVRQRAQAEVDQRFQEQEAAHRIAENHLFEGWSARLEQVRDINTLRAQMGADWLKLDQNSRQSLELRAKQLQEAALGYPPKTNDTIWTAFMLATPGQQLAVNPLRDLRPYMDDTDYQSAVRLIADLQNGGKGATEGVQSATQMLLSGAQGQGVVPRDTPPNKWSDDQAAAYAQLQRTMNLQLDAFHQKNNRNPTPTESQEIVDGIMLQKLRLSPGFFRWAPGQVVQSAVLDKDVADLSDEALASIHIPAEVEQQYTNRLRAYGKKATRTDIVRLWLAALRGDTSVGQELFKP